MAVLSGKYRDAMKAISLWQPWASALFVNHVLTLKPLKPDETRHWALPGWLIGKEIAIHAAKRDTRDEREFWDELHENDKLSFALIGVTSYETLPRGCLIGTLKFTACVPTVACGIRMGDAAFWWGNYLAGRFAWRREETKLFPRPIPCVGRQGIFDVQIPEFSS